jgi:hypothetical protein
MLQLLPTKNGTGIQVLGDYADLATLHATIHKLTEHLSPETDRTKGKSDLLMALAYEVRKAYSEQRLRETVTFDGRHKVEYFGFNYLWSDLIITYNVLRSEAGYIVTDPTDQSCLYLLEGQLQSALVVYHPKEGQLLLEYLGKWVNINHPYIYLISQSIAKEYLHMKTGRLRFTKIRELIRDYFDEKSFRHREMLRGLEASAAEKNTTILNLDFDNFPEIKW